MKAEPPLGFLAEHFGTLVVGMILALFGALISLAGVALLTWSQTTMNTENILENREDHNAAGADRFTRQDAERMEDRQEIKNGVMRDEIVELIKEVSYLKGAATAAKDGEE